MALRSQAWRHRVLRATKRSRREMGPDGTRLRGIAKASDDTILALRPGIPPSEPSQSLIERDQVPGTGICPALATPLDKDARRRRAGSDHLFPSCGWSAAHDRATRLTGTPTMGIQMTYKGRQS